MNKLNKAQPLGFAYVGDGNGNLRFLYGGEPMYRGQVFAIDRGAARAFVNEMNTLDGSDLESFGGTICDDFYAKHLEPKIPRSIWQRLLRWISWVYNKTLRLPY